jgi:hypothetical protein
MKFPNLLLLVLITFAPTAPAGVGIDQAALGVTLGGWDKRGKTAAEYELSGSTYRTYKPEVTPTPDGGLFVSLRIDHVRGWLSSDDHAMLEITISANGSIESAQSTIAIQGRSITSDLIRSGNEAGKQLVGVDRAVQIGTDLIADLTAKMLKEKIVEAGRVSYPAVLRHNYNLLFQAIRTDPAPPPPAPTPPPSGDPAPAVPPTVPVDPAEPAPPPQKTAVGLEIKVPGNCRKGEIPVKK